MATLKILMGMINQGLKGGPPGHLPYLVEGLKSNGAEVTEIVFGARTDSETVFRKIFNTFSTLLEFRIALKEKKYDVIHLNSAFDKHSIFRDFITLFFLKNYKIPIFLKTHGTDSGIILSKNIFIKFIGAKIKKWVQIVGVLSTEEIQNFIESGLDEKKVVLIKNIINSEILLNQNNIRPQFGISEKTPLLLFSARFTPQKGLIEVIQACNILKSEGFEFHLICIGDGIEASKAIALTQEYKLNDHVTFTGYILESQTKAFYKSSDILVFPTFHQEGFSMALFQSVITGLGIVTTKIRAAKDYLKEPDNCLWVEPQNSVQLADKIKILLMDKSLMHTMRENNKRLGWKFDKNFVAREYLDFYLQIISTTLY